MLLTDNFSNNQIKKAVMMSDICSAEHYFRSGELDRILKNISFEVLMGEAVGITAKVKQEARLLLEILANVRPYYSGKCVLAEKGMMQKKRLILPHLFYIDTPNMLYDNMTVLEFLVFVTSYSGISLKNRQKKHLDTLIEYGLDYIALSQIADLSDTEKLIIELLAAADSNSTLVVFNVLEYDFTDSQVRSIMKICSYIKERGSIVIGTNQPKLIGVCCDKVAYVLEGSIHFFGSVADLCRTWDKVLYLISDSNPKAVAETLAKSYSNYTYVTHGNSILVYNYSDSRLTDSEFLRILFENGISPDNIKINKGRVENSLEELNRLHDL